MLRVRATGTDGRVVLDEPIGHGADPAELLRAAALEPTWVGATREGGDVVLDYTVVPTAPPQPYQRLAAYAVVPATVDGRACVLLTSFTELTARAGWWGLPGGGLEEGEEPEAGMRREVLEETGQQLEAARPLTVVSAHWTGAAPSGRLEDFHAMRLVYACACPEPTTPVVHDVGGTTADARWVPLTELEGLPLLEWARPVIERVVAG